MRPRGDVRMAVAEVASQLVRERGCFTGRDAAARVTLDEARGMAFEETRQVLKNMVVAGELIVIGHARSPNGSRPLNLYTTPHDRCRDAATSVADLSRAMAGWAEFA